MKKYLSVFTLVARESLYRLPILWIFSALLQAVSFFVTVKGEYIQENMKIYEAFYSYESLSAIIFVLTLLFTGLVLIKTGMEFRSRSGYTLRRLLISERKVFLLQSLYNSIMLFMLLLFEFLLVFILMTAGYGMLEDKFVTNQSVYLGFYGSEFVQNLFAGRDLLRAVRNLLLTVSLGINLSAVTFFMRRSKKHFIGVIYLIFCTAIFILPSEIGAVGSDIFSIAVSLPAAAVSLAAVARGSEAYDI